MKRNRILFVIAIVAILAVLFVACDDKAQGAEPVHTHTYGAWSLTADPTESTEGSATRECACGDSETTTVAKLSDASVWTVTVSQDATHESAGFKAYKSDVYGTVTVTTPKGQHVYGGWEISVDPSEDETGVAIRKCACGHYEEVTLAVLTNASVWTKKIEAATHTAPGKVIYTSEYGVVTVLTEVEDHVYGAWTDNHNGTHSRSCECGDVETENCVYNQKVAAPAFLKSEANCTTKAVYYMSCVCGAHSTEATFESGTANGHDYYNFRVISEPNCTEAGQVVADCRNCDHQYDGKIPALGHDFTGKCIPYVEGSSEGGDEYDEEGGSSEESQYHVHTCTRCDTVDTEHKEAHVFGEAVYTLHLVHGTDNMYEVWAKYTCEECSYSKTVTNEFNRYIGQDDSWTLVEEVEADYNQAGHAKWLFNDGREVTVYTDKLVAPYEGTTYYYLEVRTPDSGNKVRVDGYTSVKVTFDENGKATGDTGLFMRIVNAATGEITFVRDDNGSLYSDNGSIDLVNGVIVRSSYGDWDRIALMIPSDMVVGAQDVSGSFWTDSKALSFNAKCNLNETHTFNVFVFDGQVYFGAQFVDTDGRAVAAKDCADASYVKVLDAEGNFIKAFAKKDGILKETDGKEGYYSFDSGNVVLDGVGGILVNGMEGGSYVAAAEGADYDYDVYVGESVASATAYYRLTLGESHTCTLVKPMTTFYFKTGVDDIEIDDMQANLNVATTLPTPKREGYVFNGWKLQGEGETVNAFVATSTTDDYTFEAQWSKKTTVVVNGLKEEDKAQYSTVYIGLGNPFVGVLPAYDATTYRDGYKFVGWYLDDGDGVLNTGVDTPLADGDAAEVEGAGYVIFAAWVWAGNVKFEKQTSYGWEYVAESNTWRSTNWHEKSTSSVMEVKWTSGVVRVEFDYWVDGESGSDYLTIYYYDVNGTRQSIITKTTGNVAKGNAVHVVCILDAEGESLRLSYSKDSGIDKGEDRAFVENLTINGESVVAQTSLNKNAGVYTASDDKQVRVGANGLVTIGENSYAGSVVSDNVIAITVDGVYTEVTLNTADMTCSIVEPKVNVSYNYNGHGENSSVAVGKYSNQTLSTDVPTAEGFIFRGWYTDEAFTTEASATFVASSDVTFYAKWDEAITLTYVYLDGTTANVVVDLYANDQVETLQAVDFKFGDSVFAGWYTKDGTDSGDWGVEFVAGTKLTTNTTVYALWKAPHPMMGEYLFGANLYNSDNSIASKANTLSTNYFFKVDAIGNVTGYQSGVITDYNPENGTFYVLDSNGNKFYGGFNAETKTMYVDYRAGQTGAYHDIKFGAAQIGDEVPTQTLYVGWNKGCTKLIRITYKNGDVESYRYILAYGKSIYNVTSWNATDKDDNAVTDFEKIYSDAKMLTVVYGDNTLAVGRKNDNFVALDGYQGTYSNGLTNIVLDGVGGIAYGTEKGTYTAAAEGAGYTFDVKTDNKSYKLTVNKDDKTTYTIEEDTVTISFVNDKVAVADITAYVGFKQTLTAPAEVEGFVFRGWYDNAEFSGSAVTSFTATENVTFYAKYDAAVTVTFDYDGYEYETGKTTLDVTGKYVNDTLGNIIPTVASDARNNGRAFAGWYFKDGEVWGEQASSSTKLTESVTIYARWVDPPASMGTYKLIEVYSVESGKEATSFSDSTVLTINADGSYSGARVDAGKLSADDIEKANGVINIGKYAYLSDALGGIIVYSYYSGANYATSIGTDFYIGFRNSANITKVEYSADTLGGGYVAFFTVSYTEDGANKTMNLFVYNETIYANVMWTSGVTAKAAAKTESVLVSDAYGKAIVKKSGSAMVGNDGKSGSYTNTDAYGEIVLDGFGTLSVNGESVAYTLDGNKVTFVAGNAMRVVEIADGTYTKVLDGYQGTYTLPDGSTLELDGYGNIAGTTNTYVVSGGTVEIHEGETSSSYGIDVEGKTLNDKSQFAGLTFSGTYNDSWDEGTDKVSLKFDDASALTGTFTHHGGGYSPAVSAKFTATFDGTKMIVTITECSESSWVGKTFELSYANDTFTITSFFRSSGQYAVSKNTKLSLQA